MRERLGTKKWLLWLALTTATLAATQGIPAMLIWWRSNPDIAFAAAVPFWHKPEYYAAILLYAATLTLASLTRRLAAALVVGVVAVIGYVAVPAMVSSVDASPRETLLDVTYQFVLAFGPWLNGWMAAVVPVGLLLALGQVPRRDWWNEQQSRDFDRSLF